MFVSIWLWIIFFILISNIQKYLFWYFACISILILRPYCKFKRNLIDFGRHLGFFKMPKGACFTPTLGWSGGPHTTIIWREKNFIRYITVNPIGRQTITLSYWDSVDWICTEGIQSTESLASKTTLYLLTNDKCKSSQVKSSL